MGIGAPELIIVLLVVLLLFGATRLPKLARSMGEATKEFKKGINEKEADEAEAKPPVDAKVTMSQAELDAMLAQREAEAKEAARREPPTPSPN